MKKGQTSVRNGIEDILFPMEVMRITQGDNVGTHAGTFATDLAGKDTGQDLAYFPFSAKSVALDTKNGNAVVWESLKPVRFADGTIDYACVMVIHDNDPSGYEVGKSYKQGQQMAQEGTAGNARGNHLHVEFAKGKFKRSTNGSMYGQNSKGVYHLNNNIPIEKACFMDNTIMKVGVADWKYLKDVKVTEDTKPTPKPPVQAKKEYITLSSNIKTWTIHTNGQLPTNNNIVGNLNPRKFGGLTYDILAKPYADVVTIKTRDYGKVNLYYGGNNKQYASIK